MNDLMRAETLIAAAVGFRSRLIKDTFQSQRDNILNATDLITGALKGGKKIYAFGNGGSAADAQHFVAELVGGFIVDRGPLPAICLNSNASIVTALSNDFGYEKVFERQIRGYCTPGDVVIGISTSGTSVNVLNAMSTAKSVGCDTIALAGVGGFQMALPDRPDITLQVPCDDTQHIQELHIMILHTICHLIEIELRPEKFV